MSKPVQLPTWDTNQTNLAVPPAGYQSDGWTIGEPVDSSFFNWYMNLTWQWVTYFRDQAASSYVFVADGEWLNDNKEYETTGTGDPVALGDRSGGALRGNQLQLQTAANNDLARGRMQQIVVAPPTAGGSAHVLEFEVDATELEGTTLPALFFAGVSHLGAYDNNRGCVGFLKTDGSGNWFTMNCAGAPGPVTLTDTGVAVSSTLTHRMRLEWVGVDYDDGPYAKFYIDGDLVHTALAGLPNDPTDEMYVTFDLFQTGAGNPFVWVSPFNYRHARTVEDGRAIVFE